MPRLPLAGRDAHQGRLSRKASEVLREEWELAQWSRGKDVLGEDRAWAKLGSGLRGT